MAVYPKRKRLTRLSKRGKKGRGREEEGKLREEISSLTLSPLAKCLSDLKPCLMLKVLQRGLSWSREPLPHNPQDEFGFH